MFESSVEASESTESGRVSPAAGEGRPGRAEKRSRAQPSCRCSCQGAQLGASVSHVRESSAGSVPHALNGAGG